MVSIEKKTKGIDSYGNPPVVIRKGKNSISEDDYNRATQYPAFNKKFTDKDYLVIEDDKQKELNFEPPSEEVTEEEKSEETIQIKRKKKSKDK